MSQRILRHPKTFATTVNYLRNPGFAARVTTLVKRPKPGKLSDGFSIFWKGLRTALREPRLLLSSSWGSLHPELLAAAFIGLWPHRFHPTIYLLGCMWEPDRGLRGWIQKGIVKLADRAIYRYLVQSTEELKIFPEIWGIDASKARLCPFFFSFTQEELAEIKPLQPGEDVFSGGNSLRDYEPLIAAARRMPHHKFFIATKLLDGRRDLPPNLEARPVSHPEFVARMLSSAVVIVPIRPGLRRAAGQQTYLNAMWLGKPTIGPGALGVRDHIRHQETGLIVDGSSRGYLEALKWVFNPHNQAAVSRLRTTARMVVDNCFSIDNHIECLLQIIDEDPVER